MTRGKKGVVTKTRETTKAPFNLQQRIEEKAYELYARRGYLHGYDTLDWSLAQDLIELENKAASSKKLRKPSVKTNQMKEEIEKNAYALFEYRGHTHGNDLFDWSLAEEIALLRNNIR